jgi:gliding motility-associated-like protein
MKSSILLLLSLVYLINIEVSACSPYGTPLVSHTIVGNNLNITVTSTSAWACCFHYQLELICNAANFTGNANYGVGTPIANTPTLCKPNTSNMNYSVYTIDISQLCPGVTYKFRVREKHTGYSYWSNWSAVITFTIPGPAFALSVSADQAIICPPDCANLTATPANVCGPVTYTWNPNIGTGPNQTVCPTVPTTYTVTGAMNVPLCPITTNASASVSIAIEPPAVAGTASISPAQICVGENVTLSLIGHTGNIQWQSSNNPGGPFTNIPGATTATYTVGPLTQNTYFQAMVTTCTVATSNVVSVQIVDSPSANFTQNNVCLGNAMTFTDLSVDNNSVTGWSWNFGNGSTSTQQNPSHTYAAPGNYTVNLQVVNSNGCTDEISQVVTVSPNPVASFNFTEVCADQLTQLSSTSTVAGPSSINGYAWDINVTGTIDYTTQNATHNFGGPGQYNVSLYVETAEGCNNQITQQISVFPIPVANFTFTEVCFGNTTNFSNSSSVITGSIVDYSWNFGDGNTASDQNPSHTYASAGTYSVILTVTTDNGCTSSVTHSVVVFAIPVANFTFNNQCFYDNINFMNTSSPGATIFAWDFDDGVTSTVQNPTHTYGQAGTYDVTLVVSTTAGCTHTITQAVTAFPQPVAQFTVDPVCLQVNSQFNDLSTVVPVAGDVINSWSWNLGAGITSNLQNPGNIYTSEGIYPISLTVTTNNGCSHTVTGSATVWPLPQVNFTPTSVCLDVATQFTDLSTISNQFTSNGLNQWSWSFGDGNGSTVQNPIHTYANPGNYNATLQVTSTNGCTNQNTLPVTVYPRPVASFSGTNLTGCSPVCFNLNSTSVIANPSSIVNYTWSLSNGATFSSSTPNLTECFENNSSNSIYLGVTLTVTSDQGCTDSHSEPNYIGIFHNPIADFNWTPTNPDVLLPSVTLQNTSLYASNYFWNILGFGASNEFAPVLNFDPVPGSYPVTLIVSTNEGCTDTTEAVIIVQDRIVFYVPNTFTPDFDKFNQFFTPIFTSGFDPFDYHLSIYNRWGELIFESFDAQIGWDGTYGASSTQIVKDGTYIWKIEFKETMSDKRHTHTGHVNLLR